MQDIRLNVPLVGQQCGYDGQPIMRPDYCGNMRAHGENACWYASACMVSYFFRQGPRLGLPSVWRPDVGLNGYQFDWLARSEGLVVTESSLNARPREVSLMRPEQKSLPNAYSLFAPTTRYLATPKGPQPFWSMQL